MRSDKAAGLLRWFPEGTLKRAIAFYASDPQLDLIDYCALKESEVFDYDIDYHPLIGRIRQLAMALGPAKGYVVLVLARKGWLRYVTFDIVIALPLDPSNPIFNPFQPVVENK